MDNGGGHGCGPPPLYSRIHQTGVGGANIVEPPQYLPLPGQRLPARDLLRCSRVPQPKESCPAGGRYTPVPRGPEFLPKSP